MNGPQGMSPHGRMQTFLAIPDKERTEAQWNELNELEIRLASGSRPGTGAHAASRGTSVIASPPKKPSSGGAQRKKQLKNFRKRLHGRSGL
jgi:hypothetical protein